MTDVFSLEKRSDIMRKVKSSRNKSTEIRLILILKSIGIKGWRRSYRVIGRPDFVFLDKRIAIFVDGCFWHGHDCRNVVPKQNDIYWNKKREKNRNRDKLITLLFEKRGWKVIRIWECELKNTNAISEKLIKILN